LISKIIAAASFHVTLSFSEDKNYQILVNRILALLDLKATATSSPPTTTTAKKKKIKQKKKQQQHLYFSRVEHYCIFRIFS